MENRHEEKLTKEEQIEVSLKAGEHAAMCKCRETIVMTGAVCTWCRDQNVKDFNYIENVLGMFRE